MAAHVLNLRLPRGAMQFRFYSGLWTILRHGVSLPAIRRRGVSPQGVSPTRRLAARRFADTAFRCRRFADAALSRSLFRRRGGVSPTRLFTAWRFTVVALCRTAFRREECWIEEKERITKGEKDTLSLQIMIL